MAAQTITPETYDRPTTLHLDKRAGALIVAADAEIKSREITGDDLLTTPETAMWLGVSKQWLEFGRIRDYGPKFLRLAPQVIRYKRSDVLDWLKEREHSHTAEYATNVKRGRAKGSRVLGRASKKSK
jgi:hypothetical protein